jgi:phosphomannomutase
MELFSKVQAWINDDIDVDDQEKLTYILEKAKAGDPIALQDLESKFSGPIEFGTAGLRGKMMPGESGMNRVTVRKASYGLGQYLLEQVNTPRVVIGYDARYNSYHFALDSAEIMGELGLQVYLMPYLAPTPCLVYAMKYLECDAGVMVTASHNPKDDNGYKVYLGGRVLTGVGSGAQIVPPYDKEIHNEIQQAPKPSEIPLKSGAYQLVPADIKDRYIEANTGDIQPDFVNANQTDLSSRNDNFDKTALQTRSRLPRYARNDSKVLSESLETFSIVLTGMHGVGFEFQKEMLERVGVSEIHSVIEQQLPDPDFPTVPFPNPEEPGALDLALAKAREIKADLIIANDPDADRMSAGCFDKHLGDYRQLSGDEIGTILGNYFAELYSGVPEKVIASSCVSSRLLGQICKRNNVEYVSTLTGFKWITRATSLVTTPSLRATPSLPKGNGLSGSTPTGNSELVFGYEEAIGFCPRPDLVLDKDGPTAGMYLALIAAKAKEQGKTLVDLLDDIAKQYGLYTSGQLSIRLDTPAKIAELVASFRTKPPTEFAGETVTEVIDMSAPDNALGLVTDAIVFITERNSRIICRPSGTEPKVKFYIEVIDNPQQLNNIKQAIEKISK